MICGPSNSSQGLAVQQAAGSFATEYGPSSTGPTAADGPAAKVSTTQVQVRAVNAVGSGGWSAQPPEVPAAPTLTAGHQRLRVSWTAPVDNGGAVNDYDVQYRACTATDGDNTVKTCATNPTWGNWSNRSGETTSDTFTSTTITNLTNGAAYQVQVPRRQQRGRERLVAIGDRGAGVFDARLTRSADADPEGREPGCHLEGPGEQRRHHHRLQRPVPSLHRPPT